MNSEYQTPHPATPSRPHVLTISFVNIHAKLHLQVLWIDYINKLLHLYIEQRNYLSGPLV